MLIKRNNLIDLIMSFFEEEQLNNVLYLGMGDDIITPLLLQPDFDVLYVIDIFVGNNSIKTFEQMQQKIVDTLTTGITLEETYQSQEIGGKAIIISKEQSYKKWVLTFDFNGKIRKLIRYEGDFYDTWPVEITEINHIIAINSANFDDLEGVYDRISPEDKDSIPGVEEDPEHPGMYQILNVKKTETFRKMVTERTVTKPFTWTGLSVTHKMFPKHTYVCNGRGDSVLISNQMDEMVFYMKSDGINEKIATYERYGYSIRYGVTEIAKVTIRSKKDNWYNKYTN